MNKIIISPSFFMDDSWMSLGCVVESVCVDFHLIHEMHDETRLTNKQLLNLVNISVNSVKNL